MWIFMLQPGIWEEVAFRGIPIPLLSRRYTKRTAIIISSIVFGIAHSFNIISPLLRGGDISVVVFQVVYTCFLGLLMGYLFVKTNSLIPSIILHYLIDTVGLVLTTTEITNIFLQGVYLIGFVGILPAVFGIIFIKFFSKN
ncbi:MAG: lysostaphin resistance A-like protein [Candidatus Hermodarchaeota archaeon]